MRGIHDLPSTVYKFSLGFINSRKDSKFVAAVVVFCVEMLDWMGFLSPVKERVGVFCDSNFVLGDRYTRLQRS